MKKKTKKSLLSKVGSTVLGVSKDVLGMSIVSISPIVEVVDFVTGNSISDAIDSSANKAADKLNEMKKKSNSEKKVQKDEPINKVKKNESKSEYNIKTQKSMYSEKLDKLIEMALMDGELTEKKKLVLFKNAEKEGVDLDEFEMVLEAKLYEKQQSMKPEKTKTTAAPKSDKFGDVKKCPGCGSMIQSFQTKCPDCGHEYRNIENVNSIEEFFRDYQKIEQSVSVKKTGGLIGLMVDTSEGQRQKLVFSKKKEFIMHFPIPNSKEDIIEFLMMAVPLAKPAKKGGFGFMKNAAAKFGDDEHKNWNHLIAGVWIQKCEQIIMKSKFTMKDDKRTLEEIMQYAKELGIK